MSFYQMNKTSKPCKATAIRHFLGKNTRCKNRVIIYLTSTLCEEETRNPSHLKRSEKVRDK